MDDEQKLGKEGPENPRPGRSWTGRYSGPIQYRRFTADDSGGRPYIFFRFKLPEGQTRLPEEVHEIFKGLRYLDPKPGDDRPSEATGLRYVKERKFGPVWKVADTPRGRTAADVIDAKLSILAHKMQDEEEVADRILEGLKRLDPGSEHDPGRGR